MSRPELRAPLRTLRSVIPTPRMLAAQLPRPNRTWAVRLWWVAVIGWIIYTGPIAYADDPIEVTGVGGLFWLPDLSGGGEQLFYEKHFGFQKYFIHSEANWNNPLLAAMNAVANGLMMGLVFFGYSILSVTGWLFSLTSIEGLSTAVGNIMGASAEGTLSWLFPSMLVIGGVVAYASRHHGGEGLLGNIFWIIAAGSALIVTTLVPTGIVNVVDSIRTAGAGVVTNISQGATVDGTTPIVYTNPTDSMLEGTPSDIAARKNMDAMWRTLVVTPWCLAEFGSVEACEQYGNSVITKTGEERKSAIEEVKRAQDGSSTETWLSGMDTGFMSARLIILLVALIVAAVFAIFVLLAGLTAVFALVMCMLLLIVGPIFQAMGCVPGLPRQWLLAWLRQVFVQLIMSVIAFTIFAGVLSMVAALFAITGSAGWMLSAVLTLTAVIAGVALRGRLEAIFGVAGDGGSGINKSRLARRLLRHAKMPGMPRFGRKSKPGGEKQPPPEPFYPPGTHEVPPALPAGSSGGRPPALPAARQPRQLPAGPSRQSEAAHPHDERTPVRQQELRTRQQPTAQTSHTEDSRALPIGPSSTRPRLTSGPARTESTPTQAQDHAPQQQPRQPQEPQQDSGSSRSFLRPDTSRRRYIRTRPTPAAPPAPAAPAPAAERVVSGEVIAPDPSTPAPPAEGARRPRQTRRRNAVTFTRGRGGLPDAPRMRRARSHVSEARTPAATEHARPIPRPRSHRSTDDSTTPRRYAIPTYR